MRKVFLGLGVSMFLLFVLSFPSIAADSNGNGSQQLNQGEPAGNVYQYQFQQANPMNESGSGPSSETPAGARNGALDGTGPFLNVTAATTLDLTGTVAGIVDGAGLVMVVCEGNDECAEDETGENIAVFGIGPSWFWESLGIDRPVVGDVIHVTGYEVDYSGTIRNIAVTIETDETTVVLRDAAGYPLWRGGRALKTGQSDQTTP
jgi:hypothetical protein